MDMKITEEPMTVAPELALIPISFEVESVLDVSASGGGLGGLLLTERRLDAPYVKDYDAAEGEHPSQWAKRFDVSNWGLIVAHSGGARVGGAAVAYNTEGVNMLEGRSDLAVLWDLDESRRNFRRRLSHLPPSAEDAGHPELFEARRSLMAAYDVLRGAAGPDGLAAGWEQVISREGVVRGLAAERAAVFTRSPRSAAPPAAVLVAPALPLSVLILSAAAWVGSAATSGGGTLWSYPLGLFMVVSPLAGFGTLALLVSLLARGAVSMRHPAAVASVALSCLDLLVPAGLLWLGYKVLSGLNAGSITF